MSYMSFNLYVLQSGSYEALTVDICKDEDKKRYVEFDKRFLIKKLRVRHLKNCVHKEVGVDINIKLKFWKLNGIKLKNIKEQNISTEEDIVQNLHGEEMESDELFSTYFQDELDKLDDEDYQPVSIITIIPATVGPSQQGVPQAISQKRSADPVSIEPRKRIRFDLDSLKKLISDIEGHVPVASPPELYPESAKDIAGRFSKEGSRIPISGGTFPDMRLDETLSTTMGNKLIKLFKNDEKAFHLLYGVSGAGKTRSIFEMAMRNELFVIYMECRTSTGEDRTGFESTPDTNFAELDKRINEILSNSEDEFRLKAERLIALEFTARVLYLILLEKNEYNLTPRNFLLAQINGGQSCIAMIKSDLESFGFRTAEIESIFRVAFESYLKRSGKRIVFAVDEASAAAKLFYPRFIYRNGHHRGLLTPLIMFLHQFGVPTVIAGTSFSLEHGRSIYSDIGKGTTADHLIDFEMLTVENIESYLKRFLNLSDCNLKDIAEFKHLAGRPRFAARLVLEIIRLEKNNNGTTSKQDVLKEAVKQTIKVISGQLESKFSDIVKREKPYDNLDLHGWKNIMETLFVNCWFFGGYISSYEIGDREGYLIETGIAHLLENNKKFLAIDEPLSVDVVKKVLLPIYKSPDEAILQKLIAALKLDTAKISDTSKGATWQYLAQAGLMNFNEKTVADFVHTIYGDDIFEIGGTKKANLPKWTYKAIIKIESYGDLEKLSWKLRGKFSKFEDDVKFIEMLLRNPTNRVYMLDPNIIMRPDGVYIGNNISHIDDYWTILISAKIYGSLFSGKGVSNDKRTTDWRYVYYEDGEGENTHQIKKHVIRERLDTIRDEYVHHGSIRIHFILPGLAESRDKSEDRGGCRVEGNDIVMYIDRNLLNKYFQNSQYVDVINSIL